MTTLPHDQGHEHVHLPAPSYWPIALALAIGLLPIGFLMAVWGGGGTAMLIIGGLATVICLMGWANSLIHETAELYTLPPGTAPSVAEDDRWLKLAVKLFLVSEAAIFGAFFAHHYYSRAHFPQWPPAGAPHLSTSLPAIATLILMASSATMEWAHSALIRGKRRAANGWLLLTIVMGVVFLGFQGHEWGFLKTYDQFTLTSGTFGTSFYIMTGFHGLHVATGLVMLSIVWFRFQLGHFDPHRHFSFAAASWYWHFVDLVWICLFFTIYLF
jgi:cytochrome c oxidase subunit III